MLSVFVTKTFNTLSHTNVLSGKEKHLKVIKQMDKTTEYYISRLDFWNDHFFRFFVFIVNKYISFRALFTSVEFGPMCHTNDRVSPMDDK